MNLGIVLEAAIALSVLYFLLATACSFFLEALNSFSNIRGKALRWFIYEMLTGHERPSQGGAAGPFELLFGLYKEPQPEPSDLWSHPLLKTLRKPERWLTGRDVEPSYIPAHLFSQALLDSISRRNAPFVVMLGEVERKRLLTYLNISAAMGLGQSPSHRMEFRRLLAAAQDDCVYLLPYVWSRLERQNQADFVVELRSFGDELSQNVQGEGLNRLARLFEQIVEIINQNQIATGQQLLDRVPEVMPQGPLAVEVLQRVVEGEGMAPSLRRALGSILATSGHDLDAVKAGIERWYEAVMDRAAGWFKRRSLVLLWAFAFVVATLLNLDTFAIARQLLNDKPLREAFAQLGGAIVGEGPEAPRVITQKALFAEFLRADAKGGEEVAKGPQSPAAQARAALPLLVSSGDLIAPVLEFREEVMLDRKPGDSRTALTGKEWNNAVDKLMAHACRSRLYDFSRTNQSQYAVQAALRQAGNSILDEALCSLEQRHATRFRMAGDGEIGRDDLIDRSCGLVGSELLSWNSSAMQAAWVVLAAESADKSCGLARGDKCGFLNAVEATGRGCELQPLYAGAFQSSLQVALAQAEPWRRQMFDVYSMLANVGPVWKVGERKQWWSGPEINSESHVPSGVVFAALACVCSGLLFLGLGWCTYRESSESGAGGDAPGEQAPKSPGRFLVVIGILVVALVCSAFFSWWSWASLLWMMTVVVVVIGAWSNMQTPLNDYIAKAVFSWAVFLSLAAFVAFQVPSALAGDNPSWTAVHVAVGHALSWLLFAAFVVLSSSALFAVASRTGQPLIFTAVVAHGLAAVALVAVYFQYAVAIWEILAAAAGWAVTALMAAFGATFWFDLLNRLVNRRGTGPRPEPERIPGSS